MTPLLSVSTVVVSTPLLMAPVPSAAKSSPLSVLLGTKTFPMPPMWATPELPLKVQLFTQLYRALQPGTVLLSLPLANLPNPKPLSWSAARLPSLTSPLPSPQEPLWCWQHPLQSKHQCRLERACADRPPHGSLDVDKPSPNTESFTIPIIPLPWLFKSFHCSA